MSGFSSRTRLEALWAGGFGDEYTERNRDAEQGRRSFWQEHLEAIRVASALEVGCNLGANLRWIAEILGAENVAGVDINESALEAARKRIPGADLRLAPARELPFAAGSFDLVFTTGVLIHQSPEELPQVMAEIVRCARTHVICGEYHADEPTEVPYRGQDGALFKRDYGALYQELFPQLELEDRGFLSPREGRWDDLTYWIFKKRD